MHMDKYCEATAHHGAVKEGSQGCLGETSNPFRSPDFLGGRVSGVGGECLVAEKEENAIADMTSYTKA